MENPLVTVYIPTYNRKFLLERAILSVINQTYYNIEVIVVDDGSIDGTRELLVAMAKKDNRIRYYFKQINSGACKSRNIAIENARGFFITGLDDDDYFEKNRVENFVHYFFNCNDTPVFLFSNIIVKKEENKFIINSLGDKFKKEKVFSKDILYNNYITNQIFIETSVLKEIGFDEEMPMWQDIECWYHILSKTKGYALNIKKYSYVHDISHPFERISNFKLEKGLKAFNRFSEKHHLNEYQKEILFSHLYNNDPKLINVFVLLKKLVNHFNIFDLKRILLYFKLKLSGFFKG